MLRRPLFLQNGVCKEENAFEKGVTLEDGKTCRPALLEPCPSDPYFARVTLWEGMYHQVRRMFAAVDNEVIGLKRTRLGSISLASLGLDEPGSWQLLNATMLRQLLSDSEKPSVKRRRLNAESSGVWRESSGNEYADAVLEDGELEGSIPDEVHRV